MKRFYKEASIAEGEGGFAILLDGRRVKTPMHAALVLPTAALAEAVAEEWRAQGGQIVPHAMPLTKLANTAIDRVAGHEAAIVDQVMAYANDLLCYRAAAPADLAARQATEWDPLLAWAAERFGAKLTTQTGITHFQQPPEAVAALRRPVEAQNPFTLAALHNAATILGSLVLALAVAEGRLAAGEAFALSQLDERYQAERWGEDHEAVQRAQALAAELAAAERFIQLAGHDGIGIML
jgi:chaperone required for assembly of F1-ATPase